MTSRERIDAVAFDLFLHRGFSGVTSDQLAAACGISRPTLFRYAPQMSAIVLDQVATFGRQTVARLQHHDGPAWPALVDSLLDTYAELDETSAIGKAFTIMRTEPELRRHSGTLAWEWRSALTSELVRRHQHDTINCEAIAASLIGIATAAFAQNWTVTELRNACEFCTPLGSATATPTR